MGGNLNESLQVGREKPDSWARLELPLPRVSSLPQLPSPQPHLIPFHLWGFAYALPGVDIPLFCPLDFYLCLEAQLTLLGLPLTDSKLVSAGVSHSALHILLLLTFCSFFFFSLSKGLFPTLGREGSCQPDSLPEVQGPSSPGDSGTFLLLPFE